MTSWTFTITNPTGLHTRPGTEFVRLCKKFSSDIQISKNDKTANAKSLIKLLKIGIVKGDVITITASGDDEKSAIEMASQFFMNLND